MLGQRLREALASDAVVSVCAENPEHSSIDLQRGHTQRRPTQFVHQHMTVNTDGRTSVSQISTAKKATHTYITLQLNTGLKRKKNLKLSNVEDKATNAKMAEGTLGGRTSSPQTSPVRCRRPEERRRVRGSASGRGTRRLPLPP